MIGNIVYLCPSIGTCQWEGKQNDVLPHFEAHHQDFFLNINYIDLELTLDIKMNYLMHLNGETYLIQIQYSTETQEVEIKLRFLGTVKKSATFSYYINIECGNFAFTSKTNTDEYNVIKRRNGAIIIDASSIRAICGRKILDNIRAYINIEGETNTFISRSIKRSFHNSKSVEVNVRQVFKRNASYRSSIRKKSVDTMEFVGAIKRKSEEEQSEVVVKEILDGIVADALEKCNDHAEETRGSIDYLEETRKCIDYAEETRRYIDHSEETKRCIGHLEDTRRSIDHSEETKRCSGHLEDTRRCIDRSEKTRISIDHSEETCGSNNPEDGARTDQNQKEFENQNDNETESQLEMEQSPFIAVKDQEVEKRVPCFDNIMNDIDDTVELRVPPKFIKPANSRATNSIFGSVSDFFSNSFLQKIDTPFDGSTTSLFEKKESFFGFRESLREFITKKERTISMEHVMDDEIKETMEDPLNKLEVDSMPDVIPCEIEDPNPENRRSIEDEYFDKINTIKCENCSLVMIPPIFMCLNGHSICLNCKPMLCPCKSEVTDIKNGDLEEISRSLSHPCRFAIKGCTEVRSCYEIRYHEVKCDYFTYKCPQCQITGKYSDIISHIKLLHHSLKIVEGLVNPFPKNSEFLVMNQSGLFFCTAFVYSASIEWSVIFCGLEKISFSCVVAVKSKKQQKKFKLRKNGNLCKSIIYLNELKSNGLKEKNAVLHIEVTTPNLQV